MLLGLHEEVVWSNLDNYSSSARPELPAEGGQVPAVVPDRGGEGGPIQGGKPAIREEPAAAHHDVPHVGGPILPPGCPTVLIGMLPAARVGDMCVCVGPPDSIVMGSFTVLIGSMPAAQLGSLTAHGGSVVLGCFTVLVG